MTHFASSVKTQWAIDSDALLRHARMAAEMPRAELEGQRVGVGPDAAAMSISNEHSITLPEEAQKLLLAGSISSPPLHHVLVLLRTLDRCRVDAFHPYERLALAKALVYSIGNLHFGPEVGVGPAKPDASVIGPWLANVESMARDLIELKTQGLDGTVADAMHADARQLSAVLRTGSIDVVICSPPYPNEKDYTRTTHLESVLLGYIQTKAELQQVKRGLVRSNTRTVYKWDDDDRFVVQHTGFAEAY